MPIYQHSTKVAALKALTVVDVTERCLATLICYADYLPNARESPLSKTARRVQNARLFLLRNFMAWS